MLAIAAPYSATAESLKDGMGMLSDHHSLKLFLGDGPAVAGSASRKGA